MNTKFRKKLIEVALPLEDINREAAREKSIRHGHPSTLHLWWARRPLAACRAVLFASLVDDPSEWVPKLLADLDRRKAAEKLLRSQKILWDERKTVYAKAKAAGVPASANPDPGPEPKLEEIVAEIERERIFVIIRDLVKWENSNNDRVLNAARAEIARSLAWGRDEEPPAEPKLVLDYLQKHAPPVYDPFCGGGSIPLEAQRLGLEAHASDLNPVPVLITKALIEIPPKFAGKPPVNPESQKKLGVSGSWNGAAGLAEDIRYYGQWMRDEAEKRIGHLYPKVAVVREKDGSYRHATKEDSERRASSIEHLTVIAWLWARTVASPNPAAKGAHVPLVRSFWLSTKAGKKAWVEPVVDQSTMTYRFEVRTGTGEPRAGTVTRNGGVCLLTNSPMPLAHIRSEGKAGRLGARLLAIVAMGRRGRIYLEPTPEHERVAKCLTQFVVPETDLPEQALGFRVQNYGMTKHRHLFTPKQLQTMAVLCDLVKEARTKALEAAAGEELYANAVATYLAMAVDRVAMTCNSLGRWNPVGEKVQHAFGRQTLSMVWDYPEANVLAGATGSLDAAVELVSDPLALLGVGPIGNVVQMAAQDHLPNTRPLYSTDPPYYDNVPYADLADFFYVWLRKILSPFYPTLLGTVLVPKEEELVADPFRLGGKEASREFFEKGMFQVFGRMRERCDTRYPTTVYYAFKQSEEQSDEEEEDQQSSQASTGWETMLEGMLQAGWQIDGTWPMRTEMKTRMRGMDSNALASSIVLVCRVRSKEVDVASRRDFLAALKKELPEALRHLQQGNIAPVDLAQAAIGPGMAVFSRYSEVVESDGKPMSVRTALSLINQSLDEVLAEQEGEFDADTRWALAWFDQNGFNEGPYGVAETLSTAKNTSVSGMVEANILASKGGKVRLLKKEELDADWDPSHDKRLTIWEITHHLIRRIEQSESAAAELIHKLGAKAEVARDLSYRLYTICERRKWSQDAIAYNSLVLAWGDINRLAQEQKTAPPVQGELL